MTTELIDVHAHVVPHDFPPDPGPDVEARWPCMCHEGTNATVVIQGKAFRKLDSRSWDPFQRMADMDAAGVSCQAISPMPELLSYWFEPRKGLDMCRYINDYLLDMAVRFPQRFVALGSVPMQDPALAARELAALKDSGAAGVELGSNINGRYLGDPCFDEFFAEAQRLDLAIFVHALHPVGQDGLSADLVPFVAFPVDTAYCATSIIRAGIPERYPELRLGFSHGGGAIVPLAYRMGVGAEFTGGFGGALTKTPAAYAARFFYDNLVYDSEYFAYLANEFAPGQVFCGTDYPFPIMTKEPRLDIESTPLNDLESVASGAARRFLNFPVTKPTDPS